MRKDHFDSVIRDLKESRETLLSNLAQIDSTIECLERLYDQGAPKALPPAKVEPKTLSVSKPNGKTSYGLVEAVLVAAGEATYLQAEMTDRIMELRPDTLRSSAQTQVSVMLKDGRLHKGDDLVIRAVKDGKVQNLPQMRHSPGESKRFSQYDNLGP